MSTKRFKDIEQVIKNAAEGYEHPFEEGAWNKMEVLLDKEKDRRRPLLWLWWLLPLLIAGGTGGYLIYRNTPAKNLTPGTVAAEKAKAPLNETNDKVLIPVTGNLSPAPGTVADIGKTTGVSILPGRNPRLSSAGNNSSSSNISKSNPVYADRNISRNNSTVPGNIKGNLKTSISTNVASNDIESQKINKDGVIKITGTEEKPIKNVPAEGDTKKADPLPSVNNDKIPGPVNPSAPKQKTNNTNSSRFYVIGAAGAEGSGVKLLSADKISVRGGALIGYQLHKNLSIQAGFFAGSKKYVAGPGDYSPKEGTYWSTVDIKRVSANCLVYEVPLNVRYDFKPGKPLKIFAATGLSSYVMKKEEYHYSYNSNGYPHYGKANYEGNQHLFSVLKVTAGIEKNITGKFSLHAAPAVSIPLAGVGEGQIKLYSTELMIGLRYQPSKKIKNK